MRQMLEFREYLCSLGDRFMGPSQSFKECYFTLLNELFIINFSQGSVCKKNLLDYRSSPIPANGKSSSVRLIFV